MVIKRGGRVAGLLALIILINGCTEETSKKEEIDATGRMWCSKGCHFSTDEGESYDVVSFPESEILPKNPFKEQFELRAHVRGKTWKDQFICEESPCARPDGVYNQLEIDFIEKIYEEEG